MNAHKRFLWLAALAAAATACAGDTSGTVTPQGPFAYVRFVHAIPDTTNITVRPVDRVENLTLTQTMAYKAVSPYTGVAPGDRHFKVFPVSTNIALAQVAIIDSTITLSANTYYTVLMSGFARTGATPQRKFIVIQDAAPTPAANQFELRAVVAAPFAANQDAYMTTAAGDPLPATATFANLAVGVPSVWVARDTGAAVVRSYNAGTTATANITSTVQAGSPASGVSSAIAGSRIGGSALTVFLFPAGPSGAAAGGYGVDIRPPLP